MMKQPSYEDYVGRIKKRVECSKFPYDRGLDYIIENDWSAIDAKHKGLIRENKLKWQLIEEKEWMASQDESAYLEVKRIEPTHWAWCSELHRDGHKEQYEVIAKCDVKDRTILAEYVGTVKYIEQCHKSKYSAQFWIPDTIPLELHAAGICIDAENQGNETRFINSITKSSPPFIRKNATMSTVWCEDQLRILIFATRLIPKGFPIVLNYDEFQSSYFI